MFVLLMALSIGGQVDDSEKLERIRDMITSGRFGEAERALRGLKSPFAKARRAVLIHKDAPDLRAAGLTEFHPELAIQLAREALPDLRKSAPSNAQDAAALAALYWYGVGVNEDRAESIRWYELAASKGSAIAKRQLGGRYFFGEGVRKNISKGIALYRQAADGGDTGAMVELGRCYHNGKGVPRDDEQAESFFQKAAELGNVTAMAICAEREVQRMLAAMDQGDIPTSTKHMLLYRDWLIKESKYGYVPAKLLLAGSLLIPPFVSEELAFQLSNEAADSELPIALASLACCHLRGIGCKVNREEGLTLLSEAIDAARRDKDESTEKRLKEIMGKADDAARNAALTQYVGWGPPKPIAPKP